MQINEKSSPCCSSAAGRAFCKPTVFSIHFNIDLIANKQVKDLNASLYGDFLENYDIVDALQVVRIYQSSEFYGGLYEVMDFSNSFIQIEKEGDSNSIRNVDLWDRKTNAIKTDIEISADNGKLFSEEGTYRILFKYSVAWLTNPTSAVYDQHGEKVYPYGLINDQYDYFYVTITNEKDGVLIPKDFGTEGELFYQLRADSVNNDKLFLESDGTINFGSQPKLYLDTVLDVENGLYYFKGNRLDSLHMKLYRYDYDSDLGTDENIPFVFYDDIDLFGLLSEEDTVDINLNKDPQLRGRPCKIVIESAFVDANTAQVITMEQTYVFTFDWE